MRLIFLLIFCFSGIVSFCQNINFDDNDKKNLYIRLYGNVDFNQKIEKGVTHNGGLDVHRIVTLFGYQFSRKTQFVAEIEYEHVTEVFIEQAWVKHRLSRNVSLKGGLLLVPMGFVNEQHEPTFFNSVERPLSDKVIIPTTWREVGVGFTGLFQNASLRYQLYMINSFLGYDEGAKINAASGLRSGRQKGAESIISGLPSLSGQIEYFGIANFKIAASVFMGKTNTTLGDGEMVNEAMALSIDSTTVDLKMMALHSSYQFNRFEARAQYAIGHMGRTFAYNNYTGSNAPEAMHGGYITLTYNLLKHKTKKLNPFIRFEHVNNQLAINNDLIMDEGLKQNIYTFGLNYTPDIGVIFKSDFQIYRKANNANFNQFNAGIGVWF